MELTERDTVMIRTLDRVHRIDLSALHKPLTKPEFHLLAFVCRSGERGVSVSQAAENMLLNRSDSQRHQYITRNPHPLPHTGGRYNIM